MKKITWSDPVPTKQGRKKKLLDVKEATVGKKDSRFFLYNNGGKLIPTMWTLYDKDTGSQHFLYGQGWEDTERTATGRIQEILENARLPKR